MCFSFPTPLPACFSRSRVAATAWPFISGILKQYKNAILELNQDNAILVTFFNSAHSLF